MGQSRTMAWCAWLALLAGAGQAYGLSAGPEVIVAPNAATAQACPDVAAGGQNFLVVWQQGRDGIGYSGANIYAARVGPDGTPLDPNGIVICNAADSQNRPRVAFDGTNWLVVWSDLRNGAAWQLYAARISQAGVVLDPNGVLVKASAGNSQVYPDLVFGGNGYYCTWLEYDGSKSFGGVPGVYQVRGIRIGTNGQAADASSQILFGDEALGYQCWLHPAATYDGTAFRVIANGRTVNIQYSIRVFIRSINAQTGVPNGAPVPLVTANDYSLMGTNALTTAGTTSVAYCRTDNGRGGSSDLYILRADADLVALDAAAPRHINNIGESGSGSGTLMGMTDIIALDATRCLLAWDNPRPAGATYDSREQFDCTIHLFDLNSLSVTATAPLSASTTVAERSPRMAKLASGAVLAVYERDAASGDLRIAARVIQTD